MSARSGVRVRRMPELPGVSWSVTIGGAMGRPGDVLAVAAGEQLVTATASCCIGATTAVLSVTAKVWVESGGVTEIALPFSAGGGGAPTPRR